MKVSSVHGAMRSTVHTVQMLWQARPRRFKPYENIDSAIGTVDATIDQLLAMSTDVENEKLRSQLEASDPQLSQLHLGQQQHVNTNTTNSHLPQKQHHNILPPPQYSPSRVASSSTSVSTRSPKNSKPLRDVRNWNPPLLGPLPTSFLRLDGGYDMTDGNGSSCVRQQPLNDQELAQFLEDERMALFLQNEEFMKQLRRNKDFMSSLDQKGEGEHMHDDAAFREKLKNMGKVSKRKFAQMARLFQRSSGSASSTKSGKFRHMNAVPSKDNLLLGDEATSDTEEQETPKAKDAL